MGQEKTYQLPDLFNLGNIENKTILKACNVAHQALGELKGVVHSMPNQNILLTTLPIQEAKESSAIENIITTQDDLYKSNADNLEFPSIAAKEVHRYGLAMAIGYEQVKQHKLITLRLIKDVQERLEGNNAGFRQQAGTALINQHTGETVYTPPQLPSEIENGMAKLTEFINNSEQIDYDPLVKMALIHHQFESIHPFYDGNGRTGRIINILYLIQQDLLETPILYLSRYINQHKEQYYRLIQQVRDTQNWEEWILFILQGIAQTAKQTTVLINQIKEFMQKHKHLIRRELPKIYSHELINNIYQYPYTKIDFVARDCRIHRNTASKYLEELVKLGVLKKEKIGKDNFYINTNLFNLLGE
ncbi:Fic family protein [Basilea psittacipulmonis]|uniref:Addiction module protein n=1 Tax=Basilea psittacipulmonis DSM 24701 TaxID=1072685 RepID=A0A077DBG0_9BURK|nr:Fic family protein [Basilea psittacipulmonis]AIL32009.1 addiction module protein [Basilea psittacipulmonis DSM 24701]